MRSITVILPKGLQYAMIEKLNPIKTRVKSITQYTIEIEYIGTIKCPYARLKNDKRFDSIVFVSSYMGSYEKTY